MDQYIASVSVFLCLYRLTKQWNIELTASQQKICSCCELQHKGQISKRQRIFTICLMPISRFIAVPLEC